MSSYITAYVCKTANVITLVTAHFHVGPIWEVEEGRRLTEGSHKQRVITRFLTVTLPSLPYNYPSPDTSCPCLEMEP